MSPATACTWWSTARRGSCITGAVGILRWLLWKSGDFFGEIALVDFGPRSADVVAQGNGVLLKITQAAVSALAGVYPTAAFKFLIAIGRILVARLRASNQRYIDSLLFPVEGKD